MDPGLLPHAQQVTLENAPLACPCHYDSLMRANLAWRNNMLRVMFPPVGDRYGPINASWLRVMGSLVKCNGKAIRENQSLVMGLFQQSSIVENIFMTNDSEWDERIELMQGGLAGDDSKLAFHLEAVRLLTICSEGKNPSSEVSATTTGAGP